MNIHRCLLICGLAASSIGFSGCDAGYCMGDSCENSGSSGQSVKKGKGVSKAEPRVKEYVDSVKGMTNDILKLNTSIIGDGGIVDTAHSLKNLDLSSPDDRKKYVKGANSVDKSIRGLLPTSAKLLLKGSQAGVPYNSYINDMKNDFQSTPDLAKQNRFVATTLVATGIILSVYGAYQGITDAIEQSQNIVSDTCFKSEAGKKEVCRLLRERGYDINDDADTGRVLAAFKSFDWNTRGRITADLREWVSSDMIEKHDTYVADEIIEDDRENVVQASNKLGKVAIESEVSAFQSVTGNVGNLAEFGVSEILPEYKAIVGAGLDLILQVKEWDPVSLVKNQSTVVITSQKQTQITLPNPIMNYSREELAEMLKKIADGSMPSSEIDSTLVNDLGYYSLSYHFEDMGMDLGEMLRDGLYVPNSMMTAEIDLTKGEDSTKDQPTFEGSVKLPDYYCPENATLTVITEGMAPFETIIHDPSDLTRPVQVHLVPQLGTISATATPLEAATDDAQKFEVVGEFTHVYGTKFTLTATNASVNSDRTQFLESSGSLTWQVEIYDKSEVKIIRDDNGESYTMDLKFAPFKEEDEDDSNLSGDYRAICKLLGYNPWSGEASGKDGYSANFTIFADLDEDDNCNGLVVQYHSHNTPHYCDINAKWDHKGNKSYVVFYADDFSDSIECFEMLEHYFGEKSEKDVYKYQIGLSGEKVIINPGKSGYKKITMESFY